MIFHFEQDLQEERRALKEDQKMHRSKAMKYLMETNRRRRQVTRVPLMEDCKKKEKNQSKRSHNLETDQYISTTFMFTLINSSLLWPRGI